MTDPATTSNVSLLTRQRNSLEQAAILLLSIGENAASKVMQKLSREEVILLSETMARLQGVKVSQAHQAFNHFFDDYRQQSGIHGGSRIYLQNILQKSLGPEIAMSVMNHIYGDAIRYRMARLQWVDTSQLSALICQEHVQLQAIFLAFLPPDVAAGVLAMQPAPRQDEILLRIARLDDINRDVIDELDKLIERGIAIISEHGSRITGAKHAANIINRLPEQQNQLLEQLKQQDASLVKALEDQMYEFFILSRQSEETLQRLFDEIPLEEWAIALKGAEPVLRDAIFSIMPKRQIGQLEQTSARLGPVPVSRIEQVRRDIMGTLRQLAEEGEIRIQMYAERTVE
ncbi:FliG C-terminal domain-containing protein [Tatumella sp. JGM118]|uniref:Flagellar motor switch protein FliG n=1 Tax=Tatumella terrea TaxID=419007 RepID=A0ABW1VZA6_9GAMM|nr:FliG C-terminal domain-containing protein [Tatumella sp. JGM118]MBS0909887.1 flagellar motor switch protein FliG [Tatumella sp. JGM118]